MRINRQDTNGVKPLLAVGELGYDNYPSGGDAGRVYVGNGSINISQAKLAEVVAVDGKIDTHVGRVDNPHAVTKAQVGLSNVDNTSDVNKPVSTAIQTALDLKANLASPALTGTPTAPTASVGTSNTEIATTAFVNAEIANDTYSKAQLNAGQLDNRYYTEAEIDTKLAEQNDASEITVVPAGNLVSTNVQSALIELQGGIDNRYTKTETNNALALKVDDTEIASVNLLRADKYLAAQNVVKMTYDINKKLIKVQYNNPTDIDYEVLSYTDGKLTNVAHYVGSVLKGNTVLTYVGGLLDDAPFIAV